MKTFFIHFSWIYKWSRLVFFLLTAMCVGFIFKTGVYENRAGYEIFTIYTKLKHFGFHENLHIITQTFQKLL